jgi:hypothetical protein
VLKRYSRSGRTALVLTGAALFCAAAATALMWSAQGRAGQGADKEKAVHGLEKLREKYAAVKSVHLAADVKIALYGGGFRAGNGSYEYWAEGDRYKIKCSTDKNLGLKSDFDMAYDGKRFYLFDRRMGVLSYRQKDEPRSVAALPNPFFLPVDYLSGDDDDCPFCNPRLPDLKSPNERWRARAASLAVKAQGRDEATGGTARDLEMPGGKLNGRGFKMRVRTVEVGEDARPAQIDRVGADGRIMASVVFADFEEGALGRFARSITVKAYGDDGKLALQAEFAVRTVEVDVPIDDATFAVGFDEAEGVWDSDEKRFVKEKPAKSPPPAGAQQQPSPKGGS